MDSFGGIPVMDLGQGDEGSSRFGALLLFKALPLPLGAMAAGR